MRKFFLLSILCVLSICGYAQNNLLEKFFVEIQDFQITHTEKEAAIKNHQYSMLVKYENGGSSNFFIDKFDDSKRYLSIVNQDKDPIYELKYWKLQNNKILIGINTINISRSFLTFYTYDGSEYTLMQSDNLINVSTGDFFDSKEFAAKVEKEATIGPDIIYDFKDDSDNITASLLYGLEGYDDNIPTITYTLKDGTFIRN